MWVAVRARRGVDKADQGPGVLKGTDAGNLEDVKERWTRRRGRAVFMSGESGERLRLRTLPDPGGCQTRHGEHLKVNYKLNHIFRKCFN